MLHRRGEAYDAREERVVAAMGSTLWAGAKQFVEQVLGRCSRGLGRVGNVDPEAPQARRSDPNKQCRLANASRSQVSKTVLN